MKIVLSADIGTSSLKAGFINIEKSAPKRLIAYSRISYETLAKTEGETRVRENALKAGIASLFREVPGAPVEAICISGNGPTLVPLLKNGKTLNPLYWSGKTEKLEGDSFFLPYIAHFKKQDPRSYGETERFFSLQEWLSRCLGAESVTVLPNRAYTPYYWDENQCGKAGIDIRKFPPFVMMGEIIGKTSGKSAAESGLKENIPIVAGGPDFTSAILGTGTVDPGLVCDRAGSSEGINVCFRRDEKGEAIIRNIISQNLPLRILPHPVEGLWNAGALIPDSGSSVRFFRAGGEEIRPEENILAGKVREAVKILEKAGFQFDEMRISGGQARNRQWTKLKERLTGKKLLVCEIPDAELCGNAACAMFALGDAGSISRAAKALVRFND